MQSKLLGVLAIAKPNFAKPNTAKPDTAKPDVAQPDDAEPNVAMPDVRLMILTPLLSFPKSRDGIASNKI